MYIQCLFNVHLMCIQCAFNLQSMLRYVCLIGYLLPHSLSYPKSRDTIASKNNVSTYIINLFLLFAVALSGGPTIHEGNVMVDGRPVCDDEWGGVQANVVCRMLGYATMDSAYGRVENDFIMDDVKCSGNEASLKQCGHSKRHNCGGGEAAGAICIPEGDKE